jgi:hypothetical protein
VVGYTAAGRQRCKTVSAERRREAAAELTQLQRDIAGGLRVSEVSVMLTQLVTRYEDVLRHQVQESAASNYFSIARNHLLPTLGKNNLSDLTTVHVDHLLARKIEEGLAPSTVRRVRSVFAQALDQGNALGLRK